MYHQHLKIERIQLLTKDFFNLISYLLMISNKVFLSIQLQHKTKPSKITSNQAKSYQFNWQDHYRIYSYNQIRQTNSYNKAL